MKPKKPPSKPLIVLLALCWINQSAADDQVEGLEFFEAKIRPLFVKHCYACHSIESGKAKGGLVVDSRLGLREGGDSGPAVIPGKIDQSIILNALKHETFEMPPKGRLPDRMITNVERWIEMGAPDPRDNTSPTIEPEAIDIESGREFWSFQPRRKFNTEHSIDHFVDPQAPRADADTLVRRLFLDLIGLPPTPQERQEFLTLCREQSKAAAISVFADRLLERKEFGEKWARHWLDVARYADSNGGDFNLTFHEAWRYRNYVIDAFNGDVPYDQFLREQIAGDLLPFQDSEQRNRQLIATGFLMVGPKMLTERNKARMHLDIADEQLDTIGRAIMGLTLGCARCHDHKFDPIPTSDYYAMAGIMHSTRTADRVLMNNVNVTGWTETELMPDKATRRQIKSHESKIKALNKALGEKLAEAEAAGINLTQKGNQSRGIVIDDADAERTGPWRKSTFRSNHIGPHYLATDQGKGPYSIRWSTSLPQAGMYEVRATFGGGKGLAKSATYLVNHANGKTSVVIDQTIKPSIQGLWHPIGQFEFQAKATVSLTDQNAGGHVIADAIQFISLEELESEDAPTTGLITEIKELEKELEKLEKTPPKTSKAMAAMDNVGKRMGDLNIRIRGESNNLGPKVPRGFLQVASQGQTSSPTIPKEQSGRVQLAEWLTRKDHPLTARVLVNRIWQQLFGQGIVPTSDNFGTRGQPPSHPELLDHLAEKFVTERWSIKSLIREIVHSHTYQQSAEPNSNMDPDNRRFHRQNRRPAPAETIRDSILAIADQLDRKPLDSAVSQLDTYAIATSGARHASLAQTGKLRQRSIYLPIVRGALPPSLAVFDFPNPDLVTGKRSITTVPTQALFMMNSPFLSEMSIAVSAEFEESDPPIESIIGQLYQRILIRDANPDDVTLGREYVEQMMTGGKSRDEAIASFVQILFCSTEFRFIE